MTLRLGIFSLSLICLPGCTPPWVNTSPPPAATDDIPPLPQTAKSQAFIPAVQSTINQTSSNQTLSATLPLIIPIKWLPDWTNFNWSVLGSSNLLNWKMVVSNVDMTQSNIITPSMGQCGFYRIVSSPKKQN